MYAYAANNPVKYTDPDGRAERPAYSYSYGNYDFYTPVQNIDTGNAVADFSLALGASTLNFLGGCLNVLSNGVGAAADLLDLGIDFLDQNIPCEYTLTGNGIRQDLYAIEAVCMANPQLVAEGLACLSEAVRYASAVRNIPKVHIDSSKYPETAQHVKDAQASGYPSKLTINRTGIKSNRAESLKGYSKVPGKQLDEYPPAMFKEGGRGADIRAISPRDNMGAGASMGNQLRNYPDGTVIKMVVD